LIGSAQISSKNSIFRNKVDLTVFWRSFSRVKISKISNFQKKIWKKFGSCPTMSLKGHEKDFIKETSEKEVFEK
jgi:hypothetical protein